MKKSFFLLCALFFTVWGCSSPNGGSIDNATILNWENDHVTLAQFVRDHRACLGITAPAHIPRSRAAKLLMPSGASQMPNWEGLWVTFQSNENQDIGQRMLMSVPPNTTSKSVGSYRRCMFSRGYLLRAM
ncbi:MAG: hypothetical protein FWC61_02605 [Proteobacteria bacterium]|nr:hypothetical protein [Pseudomonadota bacterium]